MLAFFRLIFRWFFHSQTQGVGPRAGEPAAVHLASHPSLGYTGRHHVIVLASVVTFLVGLFITRLVLLWVGSPYAFQRLTWSDPLIVLHLTVGAAAIVYFALRNDEGDFRALLCVAIALFLAEEVLSYLASNFGALPFRAPAMMTAFAAAFYGAVAVVASSFDHDAVSRDGCHRLATAGAFAVLVVSSLRFLGGLFRTNRSATMDTCGTVVLALAALGLCIGLIYSYLSQPHPKPGVIPTEQPRP
jgi:hypothetical protein